MKKRLYIPAVVVLSTLCFTGCSQAKYDGYLPDPKLITNQDSSGRPTSMPTVSHGPEDKNSVYNAKPTAGAGVKANEKDAGDAATASVVNMPIGLDEIMVIAGINIRFNGKGFAATSKVTAKILSTDGKDSGVASEPSVVNADGTISDLKLYIPKNFAIGGYKIEFSDGVTAIQSTPLNVIAGF